MSLQNEWERSQHNGLRQRRQRRRLRRRRRSAVDLNQHNESKLIDKNVTKDKIKHSMATEATKFINQNESIEGQKKQMETNEGNQNKGKHSNLSDHSPNERGQIISEHNHNDKQVASAATNQQLPNLNYATTTKINQPAVSSVTKEELSQEGQLNYIAFTTICLPIASCLMLLMLLWYIWTSCGNLNACFKKRNLQQKSSSGSKISKLKSHAKNSLKEIKILTCENGQAKEKNSKTFDKRQLTINMETNEQTTISGDDQSTCCKSVKFKQQQNDSSKFNPFDKLKFIKSSKPTTKPSSGYLNYTLNYDFEKSILFVKILKARNLPPMDLCGTSDPYVKVYMISNDNKAKSSSTVNCTFKTKIHKRTLNPIFNEEFQIPVAYADLIRQTVYLSVYDYDRLSKHDEIGQISIELNSIDFSQLHENKWSELHSMTTTTLHSNDNNNNEQLGDICLSLRYVPTAGKLTVVILEARKLKKMDLAGLSDPYVKLTLLNENGKRLKKKKTSIKKCTLNPHFNESFSFEIPFELVQKVQLHITVIDYDRVGTSEPIGKIILGCETATSGQTELRHWLDMLASPRRPIAQWHSLKQMTAASEKVLEQCNKSSSSSNNNNNAIASDDNITGNIHS